MPKTNAEHQAAWRRRRDERMASLEGENERLRRRAEHLESALERANDEIARLSGTRCEHPAESVENGRCGACREWL